MKQVAPVADEDVVVRGSRRRWRYPVLACVVAVVLLVSLLIVRQVLNGESHRGWKILTDSASLPPDAPVGGWTGNIPKMCQMNVAGTKIAFIGVDRVDGQYVAVLGWGGGWVDPKLQSGIFKLRLGETKTFKGLGSVTLLAFINIDGVQGVRIGAYPKLGPVG